MEKLVVKIYDQDADFSPLYCGGGSAVFVVMAWREYSESAASLKFWLLVMTIFAFAGAAIWMLLRRRIKLELITDSDKNGQLTVQRPGCADEVVKQSQFGKVKVDESCVTIHHYEDEELRHLSFPISGGDRAVIDSMLQILNSWHAEGGAEDEGE